MVHQISSKKPDMCEYKILKENTTKTTEKHKEIHDISCSDYRTLKLSVSFTSYQTHSVCVFANIFFKSF